MKNLNMSSNNGVAQGEILLIPVDSIPEDVSEIDAVDGHHVLAHSETGHHHRMISRNVRAFHMGNDELTQYITVGAETTLEHLRENDTHESYNVYPGKYMVRHARESKVGSQQYPSSERAWQRVVD